MTDYTDLEDHIVPYVYGTSWNIAKLDLDIGLDRDIEVLDFANPENATFADIWVLANQIAFGGIEDMGMPRWVFVDCVVMAFAAVGFMLPASKVPRSIKNELEVPDDYEGWVPISEYSICPTVEDKTVAAFSLQSRIPNLGIGTRTKALGLFVASVDYQTGVTQYTSNALRVHSRFGPMEVLLDRPAAHDHSEHSFAYKLVVPSKDVLEAMARGEKPDFDPTDSDEVDGRSWGFDPNDGDAHDRLSRHLQRGGRAWIVAPGMESDADGSKVTMILSESD